MAKKKRTSREYVFRGGPKHGDEITLAVDDPPKYLKLGMPEWCVYQRNGIEYDVILVGDDARAWRNPDKVPFLIQKQET